MSEELLKQRIRDQTKHIESLHERMMFLSKCYCEVITENSRLEGELCLIKSENLINTQKKDMERKEE